MLPSDVFQELLSNYFLKPLEPLNDELRVTATLIALQFVNRRFRRVVMSSKSKSLIALMELWNLRPADDASARRSLVGDACLYSTSLAIWLFQYLNYPLHDGCLYNAVLGSCCRPEYAV